MKIIFIFTLLFLYSVNGQDKWLKADAAKKPLKGEISKGKTGYIYTRDAFSNIDADTYNESRWITPGADCNSSVQGTIVFRNGSMAGYYDLDFQSVGASIIHTRYIVEYGTSSYPFNMKVYLDAEDGELILSFTLHIHSGMCYFIDTSFYLKRRITGIHKIFFVASCDVDPSIGRLGFQHFQFFNNYEGVCSL